MIEFSTQMPQKTSPVSGPAAPGGAAGGFTQLLSAFLDAGAGKGSGTPADATSADGQALADDGKTLPAAIADDAKPIDPALIWLPIPLPLPAPVASPIVVPPESGARGPATALPDPAALVAGGSLIQGDAALSGKAEIPGKETPVPKSEMLANKDSGATESLMKVSTAASPPIIATTPQPAGQTFAAAIAAALANHDRSARDEDRGDSRGTATLVASAQVDASARPVVQATPDAKHSALDLRDDRGLHGMIDRIEMLRDEANANDTRIRLVPDALGGVDVSLRKDGDTLHVHFTADTQATRQLLTDAQPRLVELADARGVKLGQTSVDTGTGGGANHTNHQTRGEIPRAPVSVASGTDTDLSTDQRLA